MIGVDPHWSVRSFRSDHPSGINFFFWNCTVSTFQKPCLDQLLQPEIFLKIFGPSRRHHNPAYPTHDTELRQSFLRQLPLRQFLFRHGRSTWKASFSNFWGRGPTCPIRWRDQFDHGQQVPHQQVCSASICAVRRIRHARQRAMGRNSYEFRTFHRSTLASNWWKFLNWNATFLLHTWILGWLGYVNISNNDENNSKRLLLRLNQKSVKHDSTELQYY